MKRIRSIRLILLLLAFAVVSAKAGAQSLGNDVFNLDSIPKSTDLPASTLALRDQDASWTLQQKLETARGDWKLRRFREADALLREITTSTESSVLLADAWLESGKVQAALRNYSTARLDLNQAIQEAEDHADQEWIDTAVVGEAFYWIGVTHLLEPPLPMYDQAIRWLDSSANRYPANPRAADALLILGMLKEGREDYEGALSAYHAIEDRYPSSDAAETGAVRAAQSLVLLARERDALAQLDTSIYRLPTDQTYKVCVDCELLRGNAFLALKDYPAAEQAFLSVLNLGQTPHRRLATLGLADTYLAARRPDSAMALYRRLISDTIIDRAGTIGELHYAIALADAGDDSTALLYLTRVGMRTEPEASGLATFELARRAYGRRDYSGAIRLLDSVAERSANADVRARTNHLRGAALLALGTPDAALTYLHRADSISSKLPAYRMSDKGTLELRNRLLTGIALERSGRHSEAITTLNRYLQDAPSRPSTPEALYWLAEAYYQSKLYQSTAQSLEDLIERFPATDRVESSLYMLGWAYFKQAKYDRAESTFSQLIKAYPLSPRRAEAHLRRGDCLYLERNYAEAATEYRAVRGDTITATQQRQYALYQEGLACLRAGSNDSASTLLRSYAVTYGDSPLAPEAAITAAVAGYAPDSAQNAIGDLHRVIATYPGNHLIARAYMTLGDAYATLGDRVAAKAAYTIVTQLPGVSVYSDRARQTLDQYADVQGGKPIDTASVVNRYEPREIAMPRAEMLLRANLPEAAIASYQFLAVRDSSRDLAPRFLFGIIRGMVEVGDTTGLVDTLNTIAMIYPGSDVVPDAMITVIRAILPTDTTRAVNLLQRLQRLYPERTVAGEGAGIEADILLTAGSTDSARGVLRKSAERLDSSDIGGKLWLRLADTYREPAESDSAIALIEHVALRSDSLGASAVMRLAERNVATGDLTSAASRLEVLIERFSALPEIRSTAQLYLAELYGRMGDVEKSRMLYQAIARERPDDHFGTEARDRLQSLIHQ